jgi:hypothetical protein
MGMYYILANSSDVSVSDNGTFVGQLLPWLIVGDVIIPGVILMFVFLLIKILKTMKEDLE